MVRVSRQKTKICHEETNWIGHLFWENGVEPNTVKTNAIAKLKRFKTQKVLISFLGGGVQNFPSFRKSLSKQTDWLGEYGKKYGV